MLYALSSLNYGGILFTLNYIGKKKSIINHTLFTTKKQSWWWRKLPPEYYHVEIDESLYLGSQFACSPEFELRTFKSTANRSFPWKLKVPSFLTKSRESSLQKLSLRCRNENFVSFKTRKINLHSVCLKTFGCFYGGVPVILQLLWLFLIACFLDNMVTPSGAPKGWVLFTILIKVMKDVSPTDSVKKLCKYSIILFKCKH